MSEQDKQLRPLPVALVATIIVAQLIICTGCRKQPSEQDTTRPRRTKPPEKSSSQSPNTSIDPTAGNMSLNDVVKAARTWGPAYKQWAGQMAPDFDLPDVAGKNHKLSDYRGKNVMLVFWGTWCGPCRMEIPHLIELRNTVSEDKLTMLAISNEHPALVKDFVAKRELNYTALLSHQHTMPNPYNTVNAIPCSFFIDAQGKIKLATVGLLSLPEIKAILQAE